MIAAVGIPGPSDLAWIWVWVNGIAIVVFFAIVIKNLIRGFVDGYRGAAKRDYDSQVEKVRASMERLGWPYGIQTDDSLKKITVWIKEPKPTDEFGEGELGDES